MPESSVCLLLCSFTPFFDLANTHVLGLRCLIVVLLILLSSLTCMGNILLEVKGAFDASLCTLAPRRLILVTLN